MQAATNAWYEFDVTSYVNAELANNDGDGVLSFGLKNPSNTATYVRISSKEAGPNGAKLILTTPDNSIVTTVNTLSVNEGGTNTFGVRLGQPPAANVTVAVARQSGGDADLTAAATSLTFTPANWNVTQNVTVAAAQDADGVAGTASFLLSSTGMPSVTVTATEVDDDTQAIAPSDDAYVYGGAASTNYGQDAELRVKVASTDGSKRETFLKFPLSSVSSVGEAKLRVWGRTSDTGSLTVNGQHLNDVAASWSENTITWTNRPTAATEVLDSNLISGTVDQMYEFDVTGFVTAQKQAGRSNVTLIVRGVSVTSPYAIFDSDESSDVNTRPRLLVTPATPTPPANHPPVANDATFSVAENSANGTAVGQVVATDPDAGQVLAYAITAGNDDDAFTIHTGTGAITVADGTRLDYETAASHMLTVTAADDGSPILSDPATITVNVTDVAERPCWG